MEVVGSYGQTWRSRVCVLGRTLFRHLKQSVRAYLDHLTDALLNWTVSFFLCDNIGSHVAVIVKTFFQRRSNSQVSTKSAFEGLSQHVRSRVEKYCSATSRIILDKSDKNNIKGQKTSFHCSIGTKHPQDRQLV